MVKKMINGVIIIVVVERVFEGYNCRLVLLFISTKVKLKRSNISRLGM